MPTFCVLPCASSVHWTVLILPWRLCATRRTRARFTRATGGSITAWHARKEKEKRKQAAGMLAAAYANISAVSMKKMAYSDKTCIRYVLMIVCHLNDSRRVDADIL